MLGQSRHHHQEYPCHFLRLLTQVIFNHFLLHHSLAYEFPQFTFIYFSQFLITI